MPALDMAAVDGPLQPGTRLGSFLVLHALGSGGMGVVYAAQQDRPRRTVAIKAHGAVVALTIADGRLVAAWEDGTVAMVALARAY
jgi:hypothetical protein